MMEQIETASEIQWTDSDGFNIDTAFIADLIYLVLTDHDRNNVPPDMESYAVTVVSLTGNDTEILLVTESYETSGVFVTHDPYVIGLMTSDTLGVAVGDGILSVTDDDTVVVRYQDLERPGEIAEDTIMVMQRPTQSVVSLVRATGGSPDTFLIGDQMYIVITDKDRNDSPAVKDTIVLTLTSRVLGLDTEILVMTETTETSGVFSDTLGVAGLQGHLISDTLGREGDEDDSFGILSVGESDVIMVYYLDTEYFLVTGMIDQSTDTALAVQPLTAVEGYYGKLPDFTPTDSYVIGEEMAVVLTDFDQNNNPRLSETIVITLRSLVAPDTEVIILTERSDTAGVFTFTMRLSDTEGYSIGDSMLISADPDTARLDYRDDDDPTGDTILYARLYQDTTVGFIEYVDTLAVPVATYRINDSMFLILTDLDKNNKPRTAETVFVTVFSSIGQDTEIFYLTETTETSGVFTNVPSFVPSIGGIPTSNFDGAGILDSRLLVGRLDTVTTRFDDFEPSGGDSVIRIIIMQESPTASSANFVDSRNLFTKAILAEDTVTMIVTDLDQNEDPRNLDTVIVTIYNPGGRDTEIIVLTENGLRTGVFVEDSGVVPTNLTDSTVGDGKVLGNDGHIVHGEYYDRTVPADMSSDTFMLVVLPSPGVISLHYPNGDEALYYMETDFIHVYLTDQDQNLDLFGRDTIVITIRINTWRDTEIMVLTETLVGSAVFTSLSGDQLITMSGVIPPVAGDQILTMDIPRLVFADYTDPTLPIDRSWDTAPSYPLRTLASLLVTDIRGLDTTIFYIGDRIHVVLTDMDQAKSFYERDTIAIPMLVLSFGQPIDTEYLVLTELGDTAGIFTINAETPFTVGIRMSDTEGFVSGDGILLTGDGDTMDFLYADPFEPPWAVTDTELRTLMFRHRPTDAVFIFTTDTWGYAYYKIVGDTFYLELTDRDQNIDPLVLDTVVVTMSAHGETELVVLTEVVGRVGVFRGLFPASFNSMDSPSYTGIIWDDTGMITSGYYFDPNPPGDSDWTYDTLASVSLPTVGDVELYDLDWDTLILDGYIFVVVTDLDQSLNVAGLDEFQVTIYTPNTHDTEIVLVRETSNFNGYFTSLGVDTIIMTSTLEPVVIDDGRLVVDPGDSFIAVYVDTQASIAPNDWDTDIAFRAPNPPQILYLTTARGVVVPVDGAIITETQPVITVLGEPGTTMQWDIMSISGTTTETRAVEADGTNDIPIVLEGGVNIVRFRLTMILFDTMTVVTKYDSAMIIVNLSVPQAPVFDTPVDGSYVNTTTPLVRGWAEAGNTVALTVTQTNGETSILTTMADASGVFTFPAGTVVLNGEGPVLFSAVAADGFGRQSPATTIRVIVDTAAPQAPVII
ncbi:MAG: hypothetical protein AB1772_13215, partial [Candidatus Zixiibacteriota bacterium]